MAKHYGSKKRGGGSMQFRPGGEIQPGGGSPGHAAYGESTTSKSMQFRPGGEIQPGGASPGHAGGPGGSK